MKQCSLTNSQRLVNSIGYYSIPGRRAEYCDEHVCLSACLSVAIISQNFMSNLRRILCMLPMAKPPRLDPPIQQRCDRLRTFGLETTSNLHVWLGISNAKKANAT